ncbi:flagellar basal-body MS-ring/collar protein FliF [Oceaniglobus roseus]|uniref:flagellar basal-body MS-ring/collar protein FliF n=1 Tax=Oceaniglobus roseus TaxID=1737570 RepID=UPI000C7F42FD|nr:flagellar basal-body MS-ring/collar protein FliF [Kandeliimicrobium roseum]
MEQLASRWTDLSAQRKVIAVLAAVAILVAGAGLFRLSTTPSMTLLYAGLENEAAGEIVQALEAQGVAYEIRGASIFVDSTRRDELRLTLASEGLPRNSSQGYELLDSLSGFGTTSQMFDAAYWRAKEGELARTIVASPDIQNARVHIANPGTKPFQRDVPPTASVTVTTTGGALSPAHARALRFLVASAVAGLAPKDVSVIDSRTGVVLPSEAEGDVPGRGQDRASEIKRNVERLLEARVGYGKAVVEVNVETVTEREQITERRYDPEGKVAVSQETEETTSASSDKDGGDVTVASNVPDGAGAARGGSSQSENAVTRERVNYEVSEVQRDVLRQPGAIRRMSVAVLIDGLTVINGDGTTTWQPRPDAEVEALRELVAAASGFDEARGDSLTVKTMQFEPVGNEGSPPAPGLFGPIDIDAMRLAQLGVLAAVILLLGLFVVRPILAPRREAQPMALAGPEPEPGEPAFSPFLSGEISDGPFMPQPMQPLFGEAETPAGPEEPVDRLRRLIEERKEESIEILKAWMEDSEEPA